MRRLFADAFYWIALFRPRDQWHTRVLAFNETLEAYHLYTTEFLAFYSAMDAPLRVRAVAFVRATLTSPHITVMPQTRTGFLDRIGTCIFPAPQVSVTPGEARRVRMPRGSRIRGGRRG
jgi:hypothetical protein